MKILTEPIGSVPRPQYLIDAFNAFDQKEINEEAFSALCDKAVQDTIERFEATGSPVISDGEQTKPSFATYPLLGFQNLAAEGVTIPFEDGHTRRLPVITAGPFHYSVFANSYLEKAKRFTTLPIKQAVISASAISLLYPAEKLEGYSREQFMKDLINDAIADIRKSLNSGAYNVQIDFTEARLALKLDPSGDLLQSFIDLNNQVLSSFSDEERKKIGVHSCPGGDHDSTHSADVDYDLLLPKLFQLKAGSFYLEYAAEKNKKQVLNSIKKNLQPGQRIFLGVTNVLDTRVESAEEVKELILEALDIIPAEQFGTTDDCGFSPFADDTSTSRDIAFAKIKARVDGTLLAEKKLS